MCLTVLTAYSIVWLNLDYKSFWTDIHFVKRGIFFFTWAQGNIDAILYTYPIILYVTIVYYLCLYVISVKYYSAVNIGKLITSMSRPFIKEWEAPLHQLRITLVLCGFLIFTMDIHTKLINKGLFSLITSHNHAPNFNEWILVLMLLQIWTRVATLWLEYNQLSHPNIMEEDADRLVSIIFNTIILFNCSAFIWIIDPSYCFQQVRLILFY